MCVAAAVSRVHFRSAETVPTRRQIGQRTVGRTRAVRDPSRVRQVPLHVTVSQVELEPGTFAGLVSLRLPTGDELAGAGLPNA